MSAGVASLRMRACEGVVRARGGVNGVGAIAGAWW